ncbi:MAG: TM2 domain-containing protein [Bacteroidales bacterium]|nr:TM2 domain-containing protein [Bacteroidales bacterium]
MKRFFAIVFLSLCSVSLFAAEDHRKDEIELEPIELPMVEIAVSPDYLQGVERDFLINSFALNEAKKFTIVDIARIKDLIPTLNDNQLQMVLSQDYRDPSTMLFLSIFLGSLGVDRFMLGETGLGVLKLVTAGGLGVWWLIDIFSVEDRTKEYNGKLFDETLRNAQLFLPAEETQINDNLLGSWN